MSEMIIDFKNTAPANAEHFKGGDGTAIIRKFEDKSNKIMLFTLPSGASVGVHSHEGNSEIIYLLEGSGSAFDGKEWTPVKAGACLYCAEGQTHGLINDGDCDLVFFAVVPEHHLK